MGTGPEHATGRSLRGVLTCPECGNDEQEVVFDGEDTSFLCHKCWHCWHWSLGHVELVAVETCPGCHHKEECTRRRDASRLD